MKGVKETNKRDEGKEEKNYFAREEPNAPLLR
jgi:hypothetical protein